MLSRIKTSEVELGLGRTLIGKWKNGDFVYE